MKKKASSSSEIESIKEMFKEEFLEINNKLDIIIKSMNNSDTNKNPIKDSNKKMSNISIHKYPKKLEITGQTFEIKDLLKQNKAIWDKTNKSWNIKYEDNIWFNTFKKNLEKHCSNIKIINKNDINNQINETKSNSSDDLDNEVFDFLEDD